MSAANPMTSSAGDHEPRTAEPSMEEILASIRRIIADDQSLPTRDVRLETPVVQVEPERPLPGHLRAVSDEKPYASGESLSMRQPAFGAQVPGHTSEIEVVSVHAQPAPYAATRDDQKLDVQGHHHDGRDAHSFGVPSHDDEAPEHDIAEANAYGEAMQPHGAVTAPQFASPAGPLNHQAFDRSAIAASGTPPLQDHVHVGTDDGDARNSGSAEAVGLSRAEAGLGSPGALRGHPLESAHDHAPEIPPAQAESAPAFQHASYETAPSRNATVDEDGPLTSSAAPAFDPLSTTTSEKAAEPAAVSEPARFKPMVQDEEDMAQDEAPAMIFGSRDEHDEAVETADATMTAPVALAADGDEHPAATAALGESSEFAAREEKTEATPSLFSAETDQTVASAFNILAATRLADNSDELLTIARDMIRPLLRNWIDENLPSMVERMVRAEIERVARGGR